MDRKKLIIIVVAVAAIAVVGGYFLLDNHSMSSHNTIRLSKSAYMGVPAVPDAKSNGEADKDGIYHYVDRDNGVNITSCNSNISKKSSVAKMEKLKSATELDSKKIRQDGVIVYEKNGTYAIFVENAEYGNMVMIQSFDLNLLMECWHSLKFHDPTDAFKFGNDTSSSSGVVVDVVEETQNVVGDVSSQSETYSSSSTDTAASTEVDTSYTTSGDSWTYGGYGATSDEGGIGDDGGYTKYDLSE